MRSIGIAVAFCLGVRGLIYLLAAWRWFKDQPWGEWSSRRRGL